MEKVAVVGCTEYKEANVKAAVKKACDSLGGLESLIIPGETVFLKLNLLMKKAPDKAVTTHPAVVKAVAKEIISLGAKVIIGDSPGGPFSQSMLQSVYRTCGIEQVALEVGAELNYNTKVVEVSFPGGKTVKKFNLCQAMVEADKLVSLSKLKTHGLTRFTGAVKVLFGCIPGLEKAEYHLRMPKIEDFSNMLVDLALITKPCLHLIDGIVGMEGEGPSGGIPNKVGLILAGTNPFALDVAAVTAVGIDPESVPTIVRARERDLIHNLEHVEFVGDNIHFPVVNFVAPHISQSVRFPLPGTVNRFLERYLNPKPVFYQESCIKCGDCIRSCPPKALTMADHKPEVDLDNCIRCYCCQELCPKTAVKIERPWLTRRLMEKNLNKNR